MTVLPIPVLAKRQNCQRLSLTSRCHSLVCSVESVESFRHDCRRLFLSGFMDMSGNTHNILEDFRIKHLNIGIYVIVICKSAGNIKLFVHIHKSNS